ncbi:hypothetical protein V6N13_100933 [Hibiscus sabdariffa]
MLTSRLDISPLCIMDNVISKAENKKRDRAIRREKKKSKGCASSELSDFEFSTIKCFGKVTKQLKLWESLSAVILTILSKMVFGGDFSAVSHRAYYMLNGSQRWLGDGTNLRVYWRKMRQSKNGHTNSLKQNGQGKPFVEANGLGKRC